MAEWLLACAAGAQLGWDTGCQRDAVHPAAAKGAVYGYQESSGGACLAGSKYCGLGHLSSVGMKG
jgi:hypothetical protein